MKAAATGNIDIAKMMIKYGADKDLKD